MIYINKTTEETANELAKKFQELIASGDSPKHIAVSGGSTPKIWFNLLANQYKNDIKWDRVHLYWVDERCVPPHDEQSNYKMTREFLIDQVPIPDNQIYRIQGENNPEDESIRYSKLVFNQVPHYNGIPRFDMIQLGMGDDGHTASIFPDQLSLLDSNRIANVGVHPKSHQRRVTLTGKIINNAAYIAFLSTGPGKAEMIKSVIDHQDIQYPAANIRPVSGELDWFIDLEAAKLLNK